MTAVEAKLKAQSANKSKENGQYKKIIKMISAAASKGEYSLFVYEYIGDDTRKLLRNDGFKVGINTFDRNEYLVSVSW